MLKLKNLTLILKVIKQTRRVGHAGSIENQKSCSFGLVGRLHYYGDPTSLLWGW